MKNNYFKMRNIVGKLTLCFILIIFNSNVSKAEISEIFKIEQIIPTGENVDNLTQIIVQFNRPVISLGEQTRNKSLPVKIEPDVNCKWQWTTNSTAACYLTQHNRLRLATQYNLIFEKNLKSLDGLELQGQKNFTFSTVRPDVFRAQNYSWKDYGKPVFYINFNQFVQVDNLDKILYITSDNPKFKNKKFTVKLLDEKKFLPENQLEELKSDFRNFFENKPTKDFDSSKKIIFIEPTENLIAGEKFKLILDANLQSSHGREKNLGAKELISFKTFDKPKLLAINCRSHTNGKYEDIKLLVNKPEPNKKCLPSGNIGFIFSAPLRASELIKYLKAYPEVNQDSLKNVYDQFRDLDENFVKEHGYVVNENEYQIDLNNPFPVNQKINIRSISAENEDLPQQIKNFFNFGKKNAKTAVDIFGRKIDDYVDFDLFIDHHEPQMFFPNYEEINVLEKSTEHDVLITSRNFSDLELNYNVLSANTNSKGHQDTQKLESSEDIFAKTSLGVRKILNGKTGLVFGELLGYPIDMSYPTFKTTFMTQITNFGIIAKIGHYNSLISVTDLTKGGAIQNASVKLLKAKLDNFSGEKLQIIASGKTDQNGIAMLAGTADFDKSLKAMTKYYNSEGLIIQIEKDGEMGWLPIRYNHLMWLNNSSNIWSYQVKKYGHLIGWGFTSQGIYRPGQEVRYKAFIRNNDSDKIKRAEPLTYNLEILDNTGKIVDEKKNITFSDFGTYNNSLLLSNNTTSGWYDINLIPSLKEKGIEKDEYESDLTIHIARFLVSDFKTSTFKIRTELNKSRIFEGEELEIQNFGELYSGGAYGNASISLNIDLEPRTFNPSKQNTKINGFSFVNQEDLEKFSPMRILFKKDKLNEKGEFFQKIKLEKKNVPYGEIIIDTNINEDSGKTISSRKQLEYFGVDRFVGIKLSDWFFKKGQNASFQFVVVDDSAELISDINTEIKIEKSNNSLIQARSSGNSYIPENFTEWENITSCNKKSSIIQDNFCNFTFEKGGQYRAIATVTDTNGKIHRASQHFFVSDDSERITWTQENNENFEILPEKNEYKVGDKARFMIRNPLVGAEALITTERYGILKKFVKKFDKSLEILELDIGEDDAPGFYISVVLTMPRLQKNDIEKREEVTSDMYKPTSKIGYAKIIVKNSNHKLDVNISSNKEIYKPKEEVKLNLELDKNNPSSEVEATVLVIDEAVIDLIRSGINYYNPNEAFTSLQALDVMNYSLFKTILSNNRASVMMKGANQGGDAGVDSSIRGDFENSAFFKEKIVLRKGEKKDFSFKLPDNLTTWKIIVISNDKDNLFGMNSKSFKVNKNTEIQPLLPDHVVAGDKFDARFTIYNRNNTVRTINFTAFSSGAITESEASSQGFEEQIILEPFARKTVRFPVSAVSGDLLEREDKITIIAKAADETDNDYSKFSVKVYPKIDSITEFDSGILNLQNKFETQIKIPQNIINNLSTIKISLNNSLLSNFIQVFNYIKNYKYNCLEQILSKAIVSSNYIDLKNSLGHETDVYKSTFGDFDWKNAESFSFENYSQIKNFQSENGGMTYFSPLNEYVDPYLSAATLWVINKFERKNQSSDNTLKKNLLRYLENLTRDENLYEATYDKTSRLDTKAFVVEVLSESEGALKTNDVIKLVSDFENMSLFGKAKMINAGVFSKIDNQFIASWLKNIMQFVVLDGDNFALFAKKDEENNWRLHKTSQTTNCTILSAFINIEKNFESYSQSLSFSKEYFSNLITKLANQITNRNKSSNTNNYKLNTHESMLCSEALTKYSHAHENYNHENNEAKLTLSSESKQLQSEIIDVPGIKTVNNLEQFTNNEVNLKIENPDSHKIKNKTNIYYSAKISAYKKSDSKTGINHGINISRKYEVERKEKFVEVNNENQLKIGDLVRVTLDLDIPQNRYFTIIDDYIPGFLEPIDENLETARKIDYKPSTEFYHKDLKQNRIRFYSEFLLSGTHKVVYFAQVISKGTFNILPAISQEMYNEEIYGKTSSETLIIKS